MLVERSELARYVRWDGPVETAGGLPVYVDFATSVLNRDELLATSAGSTVRRSSGRLGRARRALRQVVSGGTATRANLARLVDLAVADADPGGEPPTVLVVGGGEVGVGADELYSSPRVRVLAFDIYGSPSVQFLADAHRIPLEDGCVDAVVVQAVLEHVLVPEQVVAEIHRVLRPGGLVYAETPFLQPVHEGAYDFTRFTESGHRWLFRHFERVDSDALTGPGSQLIWSVGALVTGLTRSRTAGRAVKLGLFWLRFLDRLVPAPYRVDGACGLWFLGRAAAPPITARDAVAHYRGAQ